MKLSDILKAAKAPQEHIDAALAMERDMASVNTEAAEKRVKIKELEESIKKFNGVDPEKYSEAQKALKKIEDDNLAKAGEFDTLRKKMEEDHIHALETSNKTGENWKKKYRELAIDNSLISAASKHRAIDPKEVATLVHSQVKMDEEGIITVIDGDKTLVDDQGKPKTIDSFIEGYLGEKTHLIQGKGGGSGSHGGGGGDKGDVEVHGKTRIAEGLKNRDKK